MSLYNITGWSGGGRRPLTYNLRAGQFRNMGGCNVFGMPTRTVINNNFGGGCGYGCDCYSDCGDSGIPSWMQWCMGGGMIMNFLGQMMSAIFPAKDNKADGKGGAGDDHKQDMTMLKSLVKDKYNISGPINGKYMAKDIETQEIHKFDTFEELQEFVTTPTKKPEVKPPVTNTTPQITKEEAAQQIELLKGNPLYKDLDIQFDETTHKFKYNGQEFDNIVAVKNHLAAHPPTTTTTATTAQPTEYTPGADDKTWYDLFSAKYEIPAGTSAQKIKLAACQLAKLSTPENAIILNSNGTISTRTNKGPGSFTKINLPAKIELDGVTYNLKS